LKAGEAEPPLAFVKIGAVGETAGIESGTAVAAPERISFTSPDDHPGRGPYNACTRATAAN